MARRGSRRAFTNHPGVKLRQRARGQSVTHYARFRDPDTGRWVDVNLSAFGLTSEAARVDWARRKAIALAKRAGDLAAGAPRAMGVSLGKALEDYLEHVRASKRPATFESYRTPVERFAAWAQANGIDTVDKLTPAELARYRAALVSARRLNAAAGGARGERAPAEARLRPGSQRSYLNQLRVALNHLRRTGMLPFVPSAESIKEALRPVKVNAGDPEILRAPDVRRLLLAALKHDGKTFRATRAEARGLRARGSTKRNEPLAPFVAFLLLSGCRLGEALALEWRWVDLDALDDAGAVVGSFYLPPEVVKTNKARTVDFGCSPVLRTLLMALRVRTGGEGRVFAPLTEDAIGAGWQRLRTAGAPRCSPQTLRRVCGSFLTCAPGIFGAASAFMSARRLGHSVTVAERDYVGTLRGIPREARTLEAAMGVEAELSAVVRSVTGEPLGIDLGGPATAQGGA